MIPCVSYSHVGGVRHTCIVHACETVFPIFPFAISPHGPISFRAHPLAGCCVDRRCRWYSLDRLIHRITTVWPSVRNRGCHEIVRRWILFGWYFDSRSWTGLLFSFQWEGDCNGWKKKQSTIISTRNSGAWYNCVGVEAPSTYGVLRLLSGLAIFQAPEDLGLPRLVSSLDAKYNRILGIKYGYYGCRIVWMHPIYIVHRLFT